MLGEAFGETKAEVLKMLEKVHPHADEIRIKSMIENIENQTRPADRMEQFFAYAHLPAHLQAVSKPFGELAAQIIATPCHRTQNGRWRCQKLLESKDCAVRARCLLFKP